MVDTNEIQKQYEDRENEAFVRSAIMVYNLIRGTFGCCYLRELMNYMVEDKLVRSRVHFLSMFTNVRKCFKIEQRVLTSMEFNPVILKIRLPSEVLKDENN